MEKPLKILMLHGYTQSGPLFRAKTRALEKHLQKAFTAGVTLSYPTAPHRLRVADLPTVSPSPSSSSNPPSNNNNNNNSLNSPLATTLTPSTHNEQAEDNDSETEAYAWFLRKGDLASNNLTYSGLDLSLRQLGQLIRNEGPFDGIVGFSQGGAMALILIAWLEASATTSSSSKFHASSVSVGGNDNDDGVGDTSGIRSGGNFLGVEPLPGNCTPPAFAALYSAFAPPVSQEPFASLFQKSRLRTSTIHFIGSLDTVVSEGRSLEAVRVCGGEGERREGERQKADRQGEEGEGICRVVYHPGGHFLPASQKSVVGPLIGFIREVLDRRRRTATAGGDGKKEEDDGEEERAEDMDMPF